MRSVLLVWSLLFLAQDAIAEDTAARRNDSGGESHKNFDPTEEGELIVIVGTPPPTPSSPSGRTVLQDTLMLTPHRSADDLLRTVPGLQLSQHGSEGKAQQFFWRGFDAIHGSDLTVSVAGVPINEPSNIHGHGYVDIGFVIPEIVQSIVAQKGSFQLSQGDFATAGSVALTLGVDPAYRGHRIAYELGSTNRHRVLALMAPKELPDASFIALEGVADSGFGQNRTSERVSLVGQHRFEFSPHRFLQIFGAGYGARFDEPGAVPLADFQSGRLGFYDTYNESSDGVSVRGIISFLFHDKSRDTQFDAGAFIQWRHLRLSENFTGYLVYPDTGDEKEQWHRAKTFGGEATYKRELSPTLQLTVNTKGRFDHLQQFENQIDEAGDAWQQNRNLSAMLLGAGMGSALAARLGPAQAEASIRLDTLWISGKDWTTDTTSESKLLFNLAPRFALGYRLSPGWNVFTAYGHGLRSPEARSVVATEDNQTVHFTTARNGELGVEYHPDERLSLGASTFGIWIDNELVFDHLSGSNLARSASRRLGVEVHVESDPVPWLNLRGDITAVSAQFVESGAPIPGAPRLLLRTEAHLKHPSGIRGGSQLLYMAPRPLAHGAEGAGYAVLDFIGGYQYGRYDLTIQIDNVLASQWREGEFHFASRFDPSGAVSQLPRLHYSAGRPLGIRLCLSITL